MKFFYKLFLISAVTLGFGATTQAYAEDVTPEPPSNPAAENSKLPYYESFDDADHYDGKNVVPAGWLTVGNYPWQTANVNSLQAVNGTFYLIAPESNNERNETAYTPLFDMKAGTEYTVSFYLHMPGNNINNIDRPNDFSLTVGEEQDADFHNTKLIDLKDVIYKKWTRLEAKFTPTKDGKYCFGFSLTSPYNFCGNVCMDDLLITAKGLEMKPTADFSFHSLFNLLDDQCIVFNGEKLQMINMSMAGKEFAWALLNSKNEVIESSNEIAPAFNIPETGRYNVKLTATNSAGSKTSYKEINATVISDPQELLPVSGVNAGDDRLIQLGECPTFDTNPEYDFVCGVNHYYRTFAEKFILPTSKKVKLKGISVFPVWYNSKAEYSGKNYERKLDWLVYGDKDGKPDESNLLGAKHTTTGEQFGTSPSSNATNITAVEFDEPVSVDGTIYVALSIDRDWDIEDSPSIRRSILCMVPYLRKSGMSSLYVKPSALPEGSTLEKDQWYRIDELDSTYRGMGWRMVIWLETPEFAYAISPAGDPTFALLVNDSNVVVSGTKVGDTVRIYSLNGLMVASAVAQDYSTTVSTADLASGVYVVATAAGTQKFVKK